MQTVVIIIVVVIVVVVVGGGGGGVNNKTVFYVVKKLSWSIPLPVYQNKKKTPHQTYLQLFASFLLKENKKNILT